MFEVVAIAAEFEEASEAHGVVESEMENHGSQRRGRTLQSLSHREVS